jgi:predicted P-loop ATPase
MNYSDKPGSVRMDLFKAFVASRSDTLRRPYARKIETIPRAWLPVVTTNEPVDAGRRFRVVRVSGPIDIGLLDENMDLLWAEVFADYRRTS